MNASDDGTVTRVKPSRDVKTLSVKSMHSLLVLCCCWTFKF